MSAEQVIFNHDAAIDEYMAMVLLTTMPNVDFVGSVITNADCIDQPAMEAARKIRTFIHDEDLPLHLSQARGWNPFPWSYRGDCIKQGNIGVLQSIPAPEPYASSPATGEEWLTDQLKQADNKSITMLVNCPLTTLRLVLDTRGGRSLARKIKRLIWMGGAVFVPGNLDPHTIPPSVANPYAEWNAFWDPASVEWIFQNTRFPITIFPLDITNQAAITSGFMSSLFSQSRTYRYSELAYESYEIVASETFYDMWDVVTTCYIPHPEFFEKPTKMKLRIALTGNKQGALYQSEDGRNVEVVLNFSETGQDDFYAYVLQQFQR